MKSWLFALILAILFSILSVFLYLSFSSWVGDVYYVRYIVLAASITFVISFPTVFYLKNLNSKINNQKEKIIIQNQEIENQVVRLEDFVKKLEKEDKAKNIFYSILAHDLKNPFNSLVGFSNILINNEGIKKDKKIFEIVKHINETSKNTFNLLEELLEWGNVQNGVHVYKPKNELLINIIEAGKLYIKDKVNLKNIKIKTQCKEDIHAFVDKKMITVVIRNILYNAVKFTEKNGNIHINCINEQNFVKISITDTGVGMEEKFINEMFSKTINLSTRGTDNEKGTGLGLVICNQFIKENKGSISVTSKLKEGTTFVLRLPNKNL